MTTSFMWAAIGVLGVMFVLFVRSLRQSHAGTSTVTGRSSPVQGLTPDQLKDQLTAAVGQANTEAQLQWASFAASMAINLGLVAAIAAIGGDGQHSRNLAAAIAGIGVFASMAGLGTTERIGAYHRSRWVFARHVEQVVLNGSAKGMVSLGSELAENGRVAIGDDEIIMTNLARLRGYQLIKLLGVLWVVLFFALAAALVVRAA